MPDLVEQMYCSQQINIPPNLPFILKNYAKAAIRTQPHDLLFWSAAYFKAKAEHLPPPVKERIEYPPVNSPSGLSPGFLKVLHKQLGGCDIVKRNELKVKWLGVCLKEETLTNMLKLGHFGSNITWLNFLAIAAGYLCPMLSRTMILICEILTDQPEGGSAMIPVETFNSLYTYLAKMNCSINPSTEHNAHVSSISLTTGQDDIVEDEKELAGDIKDGDASAKKHLEDKVDSNAGLMVWPDIVPSEESVPEGPSSKPQEEGAISEDGLLAINDLSEEPDTVETIVEVPVVTQAVENDLETEASNTEDISDTKIQTDELSAVPIESKDTDLVPVTEDESENVSNFEKKSPERKVDEECAGIILAEANASDGALQTKCNVDVDIHNVDEARENDSLVISSHIKETRVNEFGTGQKSEYDGETENQAQSDTNVDTQASAVDADKEISSLPSTYLLETKPTSAVVDPVPPEEIPEEKTSVSSESRSFIILDEEDYWEHVPGIGPVIPEQQIIAVTEFMKHCAMKQEGMVMPRNIKHFLCPSLDHPDCVNTST